MNGVQISYQDALLAAAATTDVIWHRRLGHINGKDLDIVKAIHPILIN